MDIVNICFLGDGSVGKSSIVSRYDNNKFSENKIATILDQMTIKKVINGKTIKINIIDTSGQEEYESIKNIQINKNNAFFLVFSLTSFNSYYQVMEILDLIIKIKEDNDFSMIIVGNKCDLINERVIKKKQLIELSNKWNCKYFETSAKRGMGI